MASHFPLDKIQTRIARYKYFQTHFSQPSSSHVMVNNFEPFSRPKFTGLSLRNYAQFTFSVKVLFPLDALCLKNFSQFRCYIFWETFPTPSDGIMGSSHMFPLTLPWLGVALGLACSNRVLPWGFLLYTASSEILQPMWSLSSSISPSAHYPISATHFHVAHSLWLLALNSAETIWWVKYLLNNLFYSTIS